MTADRKSRRGDRAPALLPVARRLFFERGYHGTTMEQVATGAGFSKRTVYLYFRNKDELFIAVAEEGLLILRNRLEQIDVEALQIEPCIEQITQCYLWFAREHADYFKIIFHEPTQGMIANVSQDLRKRIEQHERACLGIVVKVVEKAVRLGVVFDVDPWEIAAIFWGAVTGVVLLSMGGSQTIFTQRTREELSAKATWIIYRGLRADAANTEQE
ncbi:MAG: TetR/AcrR family transcriptional regulator [Candidatus Alcyoniella australis]|nr:TetR/AcrR family transcriptional regulator [Candidatus Alcyoniella australis]